ncbi:TPA: cell division protein FtsA, partial [Candidatus Collierbacteria bacterium]|nr:cell division protein FtsA [Candidatus Collierbacteria bacterium]
MKKSTQLTAVDIGTSKITCVIATVGEEDNSLRVVGVASVPSKGIRKSQVVDIEDT